MISLDDERAIRAGDPSGLLEAYLSLPDQLEEGYRSGEAVEVPGTGRPKAVVLCGVGGSAAAADVAAVATSHPMVPVLVVRDEKAPIWVDEPTLVVCLSYSGETWETLSAAHDAAGRGARLVSIAAGGRLVHEPLNGPAVRVPATAPAPRCALGLLAGAAVAVLERAGVSPDPAGEASAFRALAFSKDPKGPEEDDGGNDRMATERRRLSELAASLHPGTATGNAAKDVVGWLGDRVPVIWSETPSAYPAAWRWKAAFNENAKTPAFAGSLPELAHHEIAGWTKDWSDRFAVIVLRGMLGWREDDVSERRVRASTEALEEAGIPWREIRVEPGSDAGELLGLMLIGDMASAYHALARGVDPAPIVAIDRLKDRLR